MKIAILGVWHVHAPGYTRRAMELGEVIGFYERNEELAAGFAREFPTLTRYDTAEALLAGEAEGVIVCSASCDHTVDIIAAAKAGKHIFTEKVLALTDAECDAIAEAVSENGVRFVISLFQKYLGSRKAVKTVVDGGELGKINYLRFRNCHSGSSYNWLPPHFYDARECGGGAMIDLGAHGMYIIDWLLGVPATAVSAFTLACERADVAAKNPDGVEDNAVTVFSYPNGAIAINETGFVSSISPVVFEVFGERGYVRMEGSAVKKCTEASERRLTDVALCDARPLPIVAFLKGEDTTGLGIDEACALTHMMVMSYADLH
jgi:predicted dehydrogenase